jgi:LysM repeat protein
MSGIARRRDRGSALSELIALIAVFAFTFAIGRLVVVPWVRGSEVDLIGPPQALLARVGYRLFGGAWPSLLQWRTTEDAGRGATAEQTYVVQRGDTLSDIASAHAMEVSDLIAQNDLADPNVLSEGQRIIVRSDRLGAAGRPVSVTKNDLAVAGIPDATAALNQSRNSYAAIFLRGAMSLHHFVEGVRNEPLFTRTESGGGPGEVATTGSAALGIADVAAPPPPAADMVAVAELMILAEGQLHTARFEEALETARVAERLIDAVPASDAVNTRRAELELVRAEAHIAFGDARTADRSFRRVLAADPDRVLDPATTSPKVLRSFARAQSNRRPVP